MAEAAPTSSGLVTQESASIFTVRSANGPHGGAASRYRHGGQLVRTVDCRDTGWLLKDWSASLVNCRVAVASFGVTYVALVELSVAFAVPWKHESSDAPKEFSWF